VKGARARGRLLLAAGSTVLTLCLLELALRLAQPWIPTNLVPTRFDRTVGIMNWPGYSGCYNIEGFSCYSINTHGWRDREHAIAKPPGVFRIAVIGDSFVEALQVDVDKTFWRILESDLRARGKPVEVLAFGRSNFDVAQYFETLRHHVSPYRPDVVVVAFFSGNDLHYSLRRLVDVPWKPYYVLDGDGRLVLDETFRRHVDARNTPLKQAYRTVRNSSLVLTWAAAGWMGFRAWTAQLLNPDRRPPSALERARQWQQERGLGGDDVFAPAPGSPWELAWRLNEKLLLAMNDYARAHDARLLVLGVSNGDRFYDAAPGRLIDPFYPEKRLDAFAKANDLAYLPMAYRLADLRRQSGHQFHGSGKLIGTGHWNERGHREVAGEIERFLAERGWLP
jgi:hypothetical protein